MKEKKKGGSDQEEALLELQSSDGDILPPEAEGGLIERPTREEYSSGALKAEDEAKKEE
jgi:hypothetical protein